MSNIMKEQPFGLWESPILPFSLSQDSRLSEVRFDRSTGRLYWVQKRNGRGVLVEDEPGSAPYERLYEQKVRGTVSFAGGEFDALNGRVVFASSDGRLYACRPGRDLPAPITPPTGNSAAPAIAPDGRSVVYVHHDAAENDHLMLVGVVRGDPPVSIASGADFYMQPVWHPGGRMLAWVEWNFPAMPWDHTRLAFARLDDNLQVVDTFFLPDAPNTVTLQPEFSPDGRWLAYVLRDEEWDKLMLMDTASRETHVLVDKGEWTLALPAWVQGLRSFAWRPDSTGIYFINHTRGEGSLWQVDLDEGLPQQIPTAPYTWLEQISVNPVNGDLAFLASAPDIPARVVIWTGAGLRVAARSSGETLPRDVYSKPRLIHWTAPDGQTVYGWYYPPHNPRYTVSGLPPVMVDIHGGPTSVAANIFEPETQYFTTRGYGWLSVNYRGSTGFGRSYQDTLLQNWGLTDVEDAAGGAQALVEQGLADPQRLIITGGSAGGFTVLNTLIRHPGLFRAAVCRYGVSDLVALAQETHKLERRYNDLLVGVLPQDEARYRARSPIFHAAAIRTPLAIFQGDEDAVVPPAQSETIVAELRKNGVPHIYRLYPGEGHGFQMAGTLQDYLEQVETFLQQHVLTPE